LIEKRMKEDEEKEENRKKEVSLQDFVNKN
jgi:hypothetical protein